ncbi:RNase H domain-containing protein [Trichonephila clavipes]|nr:RNase H domain-containing protein [Trichonephila clavipes]
MFKTIADPTHCKVRSVIRFLKSRIVKRVEIRRQLVGVYGKNAMSNEMDEKVAEDGTAQHTMNSGALAYLELHSTYINNKQSTVPPAHHWYETKRPGGALFLQCSRQEKTILTRFRSGHLRTLTFKDGNKAFPTCVRCSACQASPKHIFDCLELSKQDLCEDLLMVLDFLRVDGHGLAWLDMEMGNTYPSLYMLLLIAF